MAKSRFTKICKDLRLMGTGHVDHHRFFLASSRFRVQFRAISLASIFF